MKRCIECKQVRHPTDFHKHPKMLNGRINKCKECVIKRTIQRRKERLKGIPPQKLTHDAIWKERMSKLLSGRKIPQSVTDKIRKSRTYGYAEKSPYWKGGISKDPDYFTIKNREWINANRDRKNWHNNNRRKLVIANGGTHTYQEWLDCKKKHNNTCLMCMKTEPDVKLTIDHIIPVSRGGKNNISNIQPLCRSCNSSKSNKITIINL